MNNDSTPTDLPRTDTSANTSANASGENVEPAQPPLTRTQDATSPAQKRVLARTKKRHEFVSNLMTNLDILIYVELSIVYYMELATDPTLNYIFLLTICIAVPSSACSSACSTR